MSLPDGFSPASGRPVRPGLPPATALFLGGMALLVGAVGVVMIFSGVSMLASNAWPGIFVAVVGAAQAAFVGYFACIFFNGRSRINRLAEEGVTTFGEVKEQRLVRRGKRVLEAGTYAFTDIKGARQSGPFSRHVDPKDRSADLSAGDPIEVVFLDGQPEENRPAWLVFTDANA